MAKKLLTNNITKETIPIHSINIKCTVCTVQAYYKILNYLFCGMILFCIFLYYMHILTLWHNLRILNSHLSSCTTIQLSLCILTLFFSFFFYV